MKKTILRLVKALSLMAMMLTEINVNAACMGPCYQSKMPAGCERLKNTLTN